MKALTPNELYNSVNDRVTELRQLRRKLINDLVNDEGLKEETATLIIDCIIRNTVNKYSEKMFNN